MNLTLPSCSVCSSNKTDLSIAYLQYNLAVIGILLPTIAVFGFCGNVLSAFVYSRSSMRSSLNLYLCALGISDIFVISTALFLFFVEALRRYSPTIAIIYARGAPFLYPAGTTAQTCSIYFTVAAAIDCFICVVLPGRIRRRMCTPPRAIRVMPVILVLCVGFNVCHFFDIELIECWDPTFNTVSLEVCASEFRRDITYHTIYFVYAYTIVMAVGPLALLIVLNGAIIICLMIARKRQKERLRNLQIEYQSEEDEDEESGDAVTLILVVFLFIACNSLALIINFLESSIPADKQMIMNYLVDLSNVMVVGNSSANFIIYYAFGESFRKTLRQYICSRRWKRSRSKFQGMQTSGLLIADLRPGNTLFDESRTTTSTECNFLRVCDLEQHIGSGDEVEL